MLHTAIDPSHSSRDVLERKFPNAHLSRGKSLRDTRECKKQLSLLQGEKVLFITNSWGCRDHAAPQEALDITMRTRDSHRHGAESRVSSGALLKLVVTLRPALSVMGRTSANVGCSTDSAPACHRPSPGVPFRGVRCARP